MNYVFAPRPAPSVEIAGSDARFPLHRIYCVGRNYAAHAREMGMDPDREPPFFFTKPADAIVANGVDVPYPPRTANLHHEIELVIAIGKEGRDIPVSAAEDFIFGYAVGNDLTRRDLQSEARDKGRPWDTAKGFDHSAPLTRITPATQTGHIRKGAIWLKVNGEIRQQGDIGDLIWPVADVVAELSTLFTLKPGDLIFTGTPAGVSALKPGDLVEGFVEGLESLHTRIVEAP
jgi:fumarylpyruvate hydrolase